MPFKCYLSQYATKVLSNPEAFANEATIHHLTSSFANDVDDDETPDIDIAHDIRAAMEMCEYLTRMPVVGVSVQASTTNTSFAPDFGADLQLKTGEFVLPIHRIILSTCAPILKTALQGGRLQLTDSDKRHVFDFNGNGKSGGKSSVIGVKGCHPMTILSLCHYLYSDKVIAIWDRRVSLAISARYGELKIDTLSIQSELRSLASALGLSELSVAAQSAGRLAVKPSILRKFETVFETMQDDAVEDYNVILVLADRRISAHSTILRARSPFFATFFDRECWTTQRLTNGNGIIEVDLKQFKYRSVRYLLRYLYGDFPMDLFDGFDFIQSTDQLIELIFEIISCSNYLLTDHFTKQCSSYILQYVDLHNACSILVEASHFNAVDLVSSLHSYMANNLETLLEMHVLDDLSPDNLKSFTEFVRQQQKTMHPFIRSGGNIPSLEAKWGEWLALQDIPDVLVPISNAPSFGNTARPHRTLSFDQASIKEHLPVAYSPTKANKAPTQGDDEPFSMDVEISSKPQTIGSSTSPGQNKPFPTAPKAWKSPTIVEKSNMRSIMEAEQLASTTKRSTNLPNASDSSGGRRASYERAATNIDSPRPIGKHASPEDGLQKAGLSTSQPIWISPSKQAQRAAPPNSTSLSYSPPQAMPPSSTKHSSSPSNNIKASSSPTKSGPRAVKSTVRSDQMGPLIAPTRSGPSNIIRRSSSGDGPAWSAVPAITTSPSSSQRMSFATIQEEQAVRPAPPGPRKSIREIQEEEQEASFLKWFEEESTRIQQREASAIAAALSEQTRKAKNGRGGKGGNRGRGERGRGRGRGMDHRVANMQTPVHSNTP
ncbi:hypothetical protein FRC14_007137 [Serendipita sp. 396]|nr:hypothetical protein FRC14_007137 [Serendipita sp. 396]